jgi:hypothetical protein
VSYKSFLVLGGRFFFAWASMGLLFFGPFHFLHVDLNFSINLVGKTKDILKILEFVPKLRDGIDPPVFGDKRGEMQAAMKSQILSPQTSPQRGRGSGHPSGDEEDEGEEVIKELNETEYCYSIPSNTSFCFGIGKVSKGLAPFSVASS